jgi:hypothetical protein
MSCRHLARGLLPGLHGRNWRQSEFSKRCVVLAVDTLTLEHGELNGLLKAQVSMCTQDAQKSLARQSWSLLEQFAGNLR